MRLKRLPGEAAILRVLIPSPLRSYTADAPVAAAKGRTLAELLADLDRQFPGIRFRIIDEQGRIRRHIKFFVDAVQADDLGCGVETAGEVMIVCALSGG
jgi:hypothetical protein